MSPYGRRRKVSASVEGHQHCAICKPTDVNKSRARQEARRDIDVQRSEAEEPQVPKEYDYYMPLFG